MEFRRSLAASFLFRFFVHVASQLEVDLPAWQPLFPPSYRSAAVPFHRPPVQGLQYYSKVPGEAVVGQPTRHMAADLQARLLPVLLPLPVRAEMCGNSPALWEAVAGPVPLALSQQAQLLVAACVRRARRSKPPKIPARNASCQRHCLQPVALAGCLQCLGSSSLPWL